MRTQVLSAITLFLTATPMTFGGTINVPADYPTIQQAIDAAVDGDSINIAVGTFQENLDLGTKNLTLQGQGDRFVSQTILNGNGGSCIKIAGGQDSSTVIRGLSIRSGSGTLVAGKRYGGGIYISGASSPTIQHNRIGFNGTSLSYRGAGLFIDAGCDPLIQDNLISNNFTILRGAGGGLYSAGNPTIDQNRFAENGAPNGAGGGVFLLNSTAAFTNNEVSQNAAFYGGGVQVHRGAPVITGNWFEGNTVLSAPLNGEGAGLGITGKATPFVGGNEFELNTAHNGGGIYSYDASPVIDGNLIHDNQADLGVGYGGGVSLGRSGGLFDRNEVYYNSANQGGGVSVRDGTTTVMTSDLIDSNHATGSNGLGGGVYVKDSALRMNCSTIAANVASIGGGLYVTGTAVAPFLDTIIIWDNEAPFFPSYFDDSGLVFVIFCDIETTIIGGSNLNIDPQFIDPANRDFRLPPTSPIINAGNPLLDPVGTDLDGNPRVQSGRIDIGTYEGG